MLPVLSADGTLEFPDAESLVTACEQLRKGGHFEAQAPGAPAAGLVRLRIRLPDSNIPVVHTAALRQAGPGRTLIGMGGAAAVLERLERAVDAMRCPTASAMPRARGAAPIPAPTAREEPRHPAGRRVVVSLADLGPGPPQSPDPAPPAARPAIVRAVVAPHEVTRPTATSVAEPSPPLDLRGSIVRQPHATDLRALFSGAVDRSSLLATNLAELLRYLFVARATGRLRLVGPRTKTFWIVGGDFGPSEADPPRPEELLGHLLIKMGKLTSSAPVDEAVAMARRSRRRTGEVLVERGLLDAVQLNQLLRAQTEERLLDASEWPIAEYEFSSAPPPAGAPLLGAVRAQVAIARRVAARASAQELHARFEAIQARYARLAPMADIEETALLGDAKAGHTLRIAFPGTHRLKDALGACPLGKVPTMRLLILLEAYGALETDTAALVMARGADPSGALRHRVLQAKGHDPFRRLGAHAAIQVDQIREAYARVMTDCGPGGPWEHIDPEAAASMANLAEEAYRTLYDPAARARCRRDALGPERSRFVAELLCAHALILRTSGQAQHVRAVAEVAVELADSPEARDLLATA